MGLFPGRYILVAANSQTCNLKKMQKKCCFFGFSYFILKFVVSLYWYFEPKLIFWQYLCIWFFYLWLQSISTKLGVNSSMVLSYVCCWSILFVTITLWDLSSSYESFGVVYRSDHDQFQWNSLPVWAMAAYLRYINSCCHPPGQLNKII